MSTLYKNFLQKITKQGKSLLKINKKLDMGVIIHNRYVLYFLAVLAAIDLFYFAMVGDNMSAIIFILVGLLTSFFNKNMILVLTVALVTTHLLKYGTKVAEGLENQDSTEDPKSKESTKEATEESTKEATEESTKDTTDKKEKTEGMEDEETKDKLEENYENVQEDMKEFLKTQDKILAGMSQLEPLMAKAEAFVDKFEKYGSKASN
jgi:hypothetical protein